MLDLDARVDLDEEELAAIDVHEELDGAGGAVADRLAQRDGRVADRVAQRGLQRQARRDLDDLLMTPLHGAVALPEVHEVAVRVAQHLYFDVLGARDVALEEHVAAAERRGRFAPRFGELAGELVGARHDAHTASAAAEAGFDDQRKADPRRLRGDFRFVGEGGVRARHRRHAGFVREPPRGGLVAEQIEMLCARTDEADAVRLARAGEVAVLGEKPVAGMNRVRAAVLRDGENGVDVQVRADRLAALRGTDLKRFVGLEAMQRKAILVAVDRDGAEPELGSGTETADRDFRSVRGEDGAHRGRETDSDQHVAIHNDAIAFRGSGCTLSARR